MSKHTTLVRTVHVKVSHPNFLSTETEGPDLKRASQTCRGMPPNLFATLVFHLKPEHDVIDVDSDPRLGPPDPYNIILDFLDTGTSIFVIIY